MFLGGTLTDLSGRLARLDVDSLRSIPPEHVDWRLRAMCAVEVKIESRKHRRVGDVLPSLPSPLLH